MKHLLRVLIVVLCGCKENPSGMEKAEHDIRKAVNEAKAEAKPVSSESTSPSLKNSLAKTEADLSAAIQSGYRDEINRRSGCEAAVKEAIAVIDQYIERDSAAKQIVSDNADWYKQYRICESLCLIPTGDKTIADFARDKFREKSADEETAILHAFLDFTEQYRKTDIDYNSSIKERSTANQPRASDNYKNTYLKASEFIFALATSPETDKHAALGLEADELEKVSKMRPMFPQGSRFENTESDSKRLFRE